MISQSAGRPDARISTELEKIRQVYGDTLNVRLRLPLAPSAALQALAQAYFDDRGLLKSSRLRDFGKLLDELRKADDQAVIYSDVLN
jgi:hypothetical protein